MQIKIERGDGSYLSEIARIEQESLNQPLTEDKLEQLIYGMGAGIIVAKFEEKVIAYLAYQEAGEKIFIICSILVSKEHRRKKVGTKLVNKFIKEFSKKQVNTLISEFNLELQLFFKAIGFVAVEIYPDFFGEDHAAYHFVSLKEKERKEFQDSICRGK